MANRITAAQHKTRMVDICESDRAAGIASANDAVVTAFLACAPYSYEEMRAARDEGTLNMLLSDLPAHLVRPQAVRFLVERKSATGALWGWGDVDKVEATFNRCAAEWRATVAPAMPALPPVNALLDALAQLSAASSDAAYQRACGRAAEILVVGTAVGFEDGDLVSASASEPGRVHRANANGCTCRARGMCWHVALRDAAIMAMDEQEDEQEDER